MSVLTHGRSVVARAGAAVIGLAFAFSSLALTASAEPIDKWTFASAMTFTQQCVERSDGTRECTNTTVAALQTDTGPQVCVNVGVFEVGPDGVIRFTKTKTGCDAVADGGLVIDVKRLESASLAETIVTLEELSCDASGCVVVSTEDVVVSGTWAGVGDAFEHKANTKTEFGDCRIHWHSEGAMREADSSVTIDGATFAARGHLSTSEAKSKVICG